jgi:hypothetical protein
MLDRTRLKKLDHRYHRIAKRLRRADLQQDDSSLFDPEGIFAAVVDEWSSQYFLGYYSEDGMTAALKEYGFFDALAHRGLRDPVLHFDLTDPYLHRLSVHCDGVVEPETKLVDLRARLVHRPLNEALTEHLGDAPFDFLFVEWLLLQHPRRRFTRQRPPLPGQTYPGLGIGFEVFQLLLIMAERLRLGGILNVPLHYHNAALYHVRSTFLDPEAEGRFRALRRDLGDRLLAEATWAVHDGCVIQDGQPFEYSGTEQLCAVRRRVRSFFRQPGFRRRREQAMASSRFRVDDECVTRVMQRRLDT